MERRAWGQKYAIAHSRQVERRKKDRLYTGLGWGLGLGLSFTTSGLFGLFGLGYHGDVTENVLALAQAKADLFAIDGTLVSKGCK